MVLHKKTLQVFEFKWVIWKVFRNNDLAVSSSAIGRTRPLVVGDGASPVSTGMKKGAGETPHPFLVYTSIVSIPTCLPDNFSAFIFLGNSMTYEANRRNGGLTRFGRIDEQVSKLCWWGRPAWPLPM